ncbi:MAG: hypothetical protein BWK73_48700 [Thiothrix lacustris]|uniref:Uncharacterized protein n=1 Tax=Thiothrix lacustris TaxID=525917 RepID=A0A1Y1Q990_9GAMM|nr:MAG: hypothetical protein BWK73_48700 [Thiothrix lacustris]
MQPRSIHEPVRLENERTYLQLKPELRQTLYIAAWAITAVMGVSGVTTYYSGNPSPLGAVMALLLFLGFLLTMKAASNLLFDPHMPGMLRFLALLCIIAVVIIDVFAFSHDKQTGVMERIESANAVDAGYASKAQQVSQLQAELAACPPNHYTKCKTPLLQALQTAQTAPDTLTFNAQNAGENRYWLALAEWYNEGKLPENQVDAGKIALYVFSTMGFVGSLFAVFTFGVHGASINRVEYTHPAPPTTSNERIHERIQQRNERNIGENERNERIQQTYRHRLEAAGVTVPPSDTVLDQPIASPETSALDERNHERTSTLSLSESEAEEGGDTLPSESDTYDDWKQAVVNGQCETIVRDMRLWLQDVGAVEQGKTKQAQLVAESYLVEAQAEGFIREIPNWVSGMRRKYEWTGQGG